jgi:SAM-dependent methyltransferase
MTIVSIEHPVSPALKREIEALKEYRKDPQDVIHRDIRELCKEFPKHMGGPEIVERMKGCQRGLKILDIGCGPGFSSIYLATLGHHVFGVEPSPLDCQVLSQNARKMNLPITVYQCTGEVIDKIPEKDFDLCIFNSSFHHCEAPLKVLLNCFSVLKEGGRVLLMNEPLLKFYRSKKWFYEALERMPEKMGHYGGNERIYYHQEYKKMIAKAGFISINEFLNARLFHVREQIESNLQKKMNGVYQYSDGFVLFKFIALFVLKRVSSIGLVISALKRLSLIPITYEAVKPKQENVSNHVPR